MSNEPNRTYLGQEIISRRDLLTMLGGAAVVAAQSGCSLRSQVASSSFDGPLHYTSLGDLSRLIAARRVSPVEITTHMLDRIEELDDALQSYVLVTADQAIASARIAESEIQAGNYRGPLHGVPIGVKDLCYTRGVATGAGTRVLSGFVPTFDATVVARLKEAGAILLGKLALTEGAYSFYHPELPMPVNPWDSSRWSGVSSSGSGVATAAGLCFASIGTDTGGSIRYPSAANGCVGLKPTYGRVSRHGVFALAESLDHVGPMTRTVEDAAIMLQVMAGFDPNDPTTLTDAVGPLRDSLGRGLRGARIGYDPDYSTSRVQDEVARSVRDVLDVLSALGAEVVEVQMPDVSEVSAAWLDLCTVEATIAHADTFPSRASEYGEGFRMTLERGLEVTAPAYARANNVRYTIRTQLRQVLDQVDCLLCPTMQLVASLNTLRTGLATTDPVIAPTAEELQQIRSNDVFTKPFNFAGVPTLSFPCGFLNGHIPISAQLVGQNLGEAFLCQVGYAYEQATEWHRRHPEP